MLDAGPWMLDLKGILCWFIQNPVSRIQNQSESSRGSFTPPISELDEELCWSYYNSLNPQKG